MDVREEPQAAIASWLTSHNVSEHEAMSILVVC